MKVALFTNARDELHIKEWAAHHLLIGFDYITIFDHKSRIPLKRVFANFDKRVKICPYYKQSTDVKLKLMKVAAVMARNMGADWMLYLDADEFLVLHPSIRGVRYMLAKYSFANSLAINWLMFGSNYLKDEPKDQLMLEMYTRSEPRLDQHVKTFVRPHLVTYVKTPHYYGTANVRRGAGTGAADTASGSDVISWAIPSSENLLNSFSLFGPMHAPYSFNPLGTEKTFQEAPAYIAHYVYQCEESFIRRKVNLPADDSGQKRAGIEGLLADGFHNMYNSTVNVYPRNKYAAQVRQFLEYQERNIDHTERVQQMANDWNERQRMRRQQYQQSLAEQQRNSGIEKRRIMMQSIKEEREGDNVADELDNWFASAMTSIIECDELAEEGEEGEGDIEYEDLSSEYDAATNNNHNLNTLKPLITHL